MTPHHWQQVKLILVDALECESVAERALLVDQRCAGDGLLKRDVEDYLKADGGLDDEAFIRLCIGSGLCLPSDSGNE